MMNWKGFRRKELLPNGGTITAFAWRKRKTVRNLSWDSQDLN
jgi:hypothetical protein